MKYIKFLVLLNKTMLW